MNEETTSAPVRDRAVVAGFAAGIVLGVQIIQHLGQAILNLLIYSGQGATSDGMSWIVLSLLWTVIIAVLPFVLGVFLCFWLLAPITANLRITNVIARSLLAVAAGTVVAFLFNVARVLLSGFDESAGQVFGWAYGAALTAAGNIGWAVTQAVSSAGFMMFSVAPLTVLAGVLGWLWVRTRPVTVMNPTNTGDV